MLSRMPIVIAVVFALAACGGGDGSTGGESLSDLPAETRILAAAPEAVHRAAGASPRFGSVSQGSNARDGITTDRVSIAYVPDIAGLHPVVTIHTGDGAVLRTNTNPRSVDVELPAGRIVQMTVDGDQGSVPIDEVERQFTRADWKVAEEEEYRRLVIEFGEALARETFVNWYGAYPIPDSAPYDSASRPFYYSSYEQWVSPPVVGLQHPKGRALNEVYADDVLDNSVRGPGQYTGVSVTALTDYPAADAAGADDYLTWGSWIYYTVTPTELDFGSGAFADGAETAATEVPVAGTASYAGLIQAVAIRGGTPSRGNLDDDAYWNDRVAFLRGDVNLRANFESSTVTGTIAGIREAARQGSDESAAYFPRNVTINLGGLYRTLPLNAKRSSPYP